METKKRVKREQEDHNKQNTQRENIIIVCVDLLSVK